MVPQHRNKGRKQPAGQKGLIVIAKVQALAPGPVIRLVMDRPSTEHQRKADPHHKKQDQPKFQAQTENNNRYPRAPLQSLTPILHSALHPLHKQGALGWKGPVVNVEDAPFQKVSGQL